MAINESGTAVDGGYSRIWIVCVMPNRVLTAFYDQMSSGKWEDFPKRTVNCGNINKPKWIDLKKAMKETKFGRGAWMHSFWRDWLLFNGEFGSLSNAVRLLKGEIQCIPKKEPEKNPVIEEVVKKVEQMSGLVDDERGFEVISGRKWVRIDYSSSGWLMVDKESGDIYGILGYLKVNLNDKVGNVFNLSARDIIQKVSPFLLK